MTTKKYYTLCEKTPGRAWTPEFGSYIKAEVVQERADRKESGDFQKGTEFEIITTGPGQRSVDDGVKALNDRPVIVKPTRLTPNQLALMASILGVSNAGSDHLFAGPHPQHTPDTITRVYKDARRPLTVEDVTSDLAGGLCENEKMLKMFTDEAKSWVRTLKPMTVEKIKATWPRYAAFVECVQ